MKASKFKKYGRKTLKIAIWVFASFLFLFLVISIALQFPSVQTFLTNKITAQISERVDTHFSIDKVAIRFPKSVGLRGIYAEDEKGDTLLYVGSIFVDVNMMALFRSQVKVNRLELSDVAANMKRMDPDTIYNYQFLINAFAADPQEQNNDAGNITENDEDNGSAWEIAVNHVRLQNIRYHMVDHFTGIDLSVKFENLRTHLGDADILNEIYHLGETTLNDLNISMDMQPRSVPSIPDTINAGMPTLDLALKLLHVTDLSFYYTSYDETVMDISTAFLELKPESIQLHNYLIDLDYLDVKDLIADFIFPASEPEGEITPQVALSDTIRDPFKFDFSEIMDWTVKAQRIKLEESFFAMKQGNPPPSNTFNPQDITIQEINLHLANVNVSPNDLQLEINKGEMRFSPDFKVNDLRAEIDMGANSRIDIKGFHTTSSQLAFTFHSNENFLKVNEEDIFDYEIELEITEGHIQQDLAFFIPDLNQYYFNWPENQGVKFGGKIHGKPSNIVAEKFWIEGPDFFGANLSGRVVGLPDLDSLYMDIPELMVFASPRSFFDNLPDSLQPDGLEMPAWFILETTGKGSVENFNTNTQFRSDLGNFTLEARLENTPEIKENFLAEFNTESFDLGKLLKQGESITEPIALNITIDGHGLKPQNMVMDGNLRLQNLVYNQYHYDDLTFNIQLHDSIVSLQSAYLDEQLSYDIDGTYGLFSNSPTLSAQINLAYAQLNELGFTEQNILVKTDVITQLDLNVNDFIDGHITIENSAIASKGEIYELPRIHIQSTSAPSDYKINMRSQIADLNFEGNFSPASIPAELSRHISQYYELPELAPDTLSQDEKYFNLNLKIRPDELLTQIVLGDADSYDTLNLTASYNSLNQQLLVEAIWPGVNYGNIELTQLYATVVSDENKLDFNLDLLKVTIGDIIIHELESSGYFEDQNLHFDVGLKDGQSIPLYGLKGDVAFSDSITTFHLKPEGLMLNAESWTIPDSNYVAFGEKYIRIEDFILSSNEREISLTTREHDLDYPIIDVTLKQIDLGRLTDFSGSDYTTLGGMLNGNASLKNIYDDFAFLANISVSDFAFKGDTIGQIEIKAENPRSDVYEVFASIQGNLTDLTIEGDYITGENKGIDLNINLERLDLPSFENFVAENLTDLEGYLSGKIGITGTTEEPLIDGELNIHETSFRVTAINAKYFLKSEKIVFDRQNIRFQNLALEDSTGHNANINGSINFVDLNQLVFNIDLSSRNFLFMNLKPDQNEIYSGSILMDSDLRLRGNQTNPTIDGRIKLNEGSSFTFQIPQSDPEAIGDEGVVEFVQIGDTLFYRMASDQTGTDPLTSSFEMLDVSVNVEVDNQTEIKVIIDEYAGDFLQVRGGGVLSFGIDPGGRISLTGRYEMVDGEYLLTFYDVIRRNFRIQSGSNFIWTGDPLNADVDITAVYTIRTAARELMVSYLTSDQAQSAALRQQYPFLVYLKMKGNLLEPQISFELDLPPEHRNAFDGGLMARINQVNQNESELNKQVFALLILGSFIQDNPFASMGGGDLSSTARNSASQLLTQQLNRLSDRYIRGVDINFEVESFVDFADGQGAGRTELQMEVSRDFFDDRVRVTVGGNIELEDETRRETNTADIAGDFTIEYLLTPNGNLILKGFRTKNYGDIFDGQVYETGLSLLFSRSYNKFRDLFRKEEEPKVEEEN